MVRHGANFAVPGHIEGEHAKMACDVLVQHQVAELTAVGAGGVQADERDAFARFLEIEPVRTPVQIELHVPADNRLENHDRCSDESRRGNASTSLRYCRLAISGWRSPSSDAQ